MVRIRPRARWTVALLAAAVLLTGCGGSDEETAASGGSTAEPASGNEVAEPGVSADAAQAAEAAATGGAGSTGGVVLNPVAFAGRDVVFTADLSVEVDDVGAAAARAETIVGAAGGLVAGEETSRDPDSPGKSRASLTLRVPADSFRQTLAALAALGRPVTQTQTAQDVTEEVTDLDSRLATQRASVERVRALLAKAEVIADVVSIEGELARREAELESLQARRARLADLTALSTITVTFAGPGPGVAVAAAASQQGFLTGLSDGWDAFRAVVVIMLTVLGAVLPFVLVGALVVLPLLALRRRRARHPLAPRPEQVPVQPSAS